MSNPTLARCPEYQKFEMDADGHVCNPGPRMVAKLQAIPLPDLKDKSVLDVGCDFGFWSFLAASRGARTVIGLDRNRPVNGEHFDIIASNNQIVDSYKRLRNCHFFAADIGKQWPDAGRFDVVFLFSLYHHIFENCGDHDAIWFWLWNNTADDGEVLWENPVDLSDGVANAHITGDKRAHYTKELILKAASGFFTAEHIGPALHETTREVWRFKKKPSGACETLRGRVEAGAGGATKAFLYGDMRRCEEIYRALNVFPFPGSLNVRLEAPFDFGRGYVRVKILDVVERSQGFESPWTPRWCRFYPVDVVGVHLSCYLMRFEGDDYPLDSIEVICDSRLRDMLEGEAVVIERPAAP